MLLKVQKRDLTGKKVDQLRRQGTIPASVYGPSSEPQNIVVNYVDFRNAFREAGYSNLLDLEIEGGKKVKALIKEVQMDPVRSNFLHVSFYQVDMSKPITAE